MFPEERATPLALLNYADFVGRDALVEQVDSARADWYCGCGCATVNLSVDPTVPSARKTYRPIPNEAMVVELNGENIGGIIVFADDGYLSNLEIFWCDEPISPFPPLDRATAVQGTVRLGQVSALGLPRNRPVDGAPMTSGRQWRLKQ
jgi:hypothetical protein